MFERYGHELKVLEWGARLRCSKCGSHDCDFVVAGYSRPHRVSPCPALGSCWPRAILLDRMTDARAGPGLIGRESPSADLPATGANAAHPENPPFFEPAHARLSGLAPAACGML